MKIFSLFAVASLVICSLSLIGCQEQSVATDEHGVASLAKGFDEFGYNEQTSLFVGAADGVDRNLDGLLWGSPSYANDHLVMNWNDEWDRGNDEAWASPPYFAWTNNEWNGQVPGGSGETWVYKIIWVGPDLESSGYWVEGGYGIWGQFEVIFSQGTYGNEHFWDAHAHPTGYNWN
jgi:hypothetical protein